MSVWLTVTTFRQLCFDLAANAEWASESEPIPPFESRYPGRLEASLGAPQQTYGNQLLYPTLIDQATILFYLLIKNHPFVNGNKRIAVTGLLVFLFLNGKWLSASQDDLYQLTVAVAESLPSERDRMSERVKEFLREHLS